MELNSEWTAPDQTVSVVTWTDGMVQVVTDPDYTSEDWKAVCSRVAELDVGPLELSDYADDLDLWTAARKLPTAA
jgi:hypothetical protein